MAAAAAAAVTPALKASRIAKNCTAVSSAMMLGEYVASSSVLGWSAPRRYGRRLMMRVIFSAMDCACVLMFGDFHLNL